jgi:hypothetical protein
MMLAAFFAFGLPLVVTSTLDGIMGNSGMAAPHWLRAWAHATGLIENVALGPAVAGSLLFVAERQRLDWKWPVMTAVILAVAEFHVVTRFPPPGQHGGQIGITVLGELSGPPFPAVGPLWGVQFLLTLAPLLWLLRTRFAGSRTAR